MATESIGTWCHRGTLYVTGNSTPETTVDTTPRQIAALDTKGVEQGLTVDTTNGYITVAEAGDYLVIGDVSFSGTNSSTYNVEIYKNTSGTSHMLERKLGTGGDVGQGSVHAVITCAASDDISLYQYTADGSAMTVTDAQLSVIRLS